MTIAFIGGLVLGGSFGACIMSWIMIGAMADRATGGDLS